MTVLTPWHSDPPPAREPGVSGEWEPHGSTGTGPLIVLRGGKVKFFPPGKIMHLGDQLDCVLSRKKNLKEMRLTL